MQLLTVSQLRQRFDVSINKDDAIINSVISEIENVYAKPFLTGELYAFLLENTNISPENQFASKLMTGGFYDVSPYKKHFNGLIDALAFLSYARLLLNTTVVTRYGSVNKIDPKSSNQNYTDLLSQVSRYEKTGKKYIEDVIEYINTLDAEDYTIEANYITLAQNNTCVKIDGILSEWI